MVDGIQIGIAFKLNQEVVKIYKIKSNGQVKLIGSDDCTKNYGVDDLRKVINGILRDGGIEEIDFDKTGNNDSESFNKKEDEEDDENDRKKEEDKDKDVEDSGDGEGDENFESSIPVED